MTRRFSVQASAGLLLFAHVTVAQTPADPGSQDTAVAASVATAAASAVIPAQQAPGPVLLELLEFIGEFTTEDGTWVDPSALLELAPGELATAPGREAQVMGNTNTEGEQTAAPVANCKSTRCE